MDNYFKPGDQVLLKDGGFRTGIVGTVVRQGPLYVELSIKEVPTHRNVPGTYLFSPTALELIERGPEECVRIKQALKKGYFEFTVTRSHVPCIHFAQMTEATYDKLGYGIQTETIWSIMTPGNYAHSRLDGNVVITMLLKGKWNLWTPVLPADAPTPTIEQLTERVRELRRLEAYTDERVGELVDEIEALTKASAEFGEDACNAEQELLKALRTTAA